MMFSKDIIYKSLFSFFFVGIILIIILMASTPPVDRDALTHHLLIPKLYIKNGGIYEIPEIEFSYYPQFVEMLYSIPLYFEKDIIPKYIHFAFALFTSVFVFKTVRLREGEFAASCGAMFFLTIPVIVKLSVTGYVDLGLYFFSYVSLFFLIIWHRHDQLKYLIFSAISCGLAMSCKYNGLITFFCMFFSFLWLASKKYSLTKNVLSKLFLYCFISIAVFSPWLIKNYLWTGNPVYPLYNNIINSPRNSVRPVDNITGTKSHFYYRRVVFKETLEETLSIPLRIFFLGKDDDPKFFDGVLNPFLFIMPFITMLAEFLKYRKNRNPDYEKVILFMFSWVYIIFVYFQADMRIRWVGPAIAPLVVLTIFGFCDLWNATFLNGGKIKLFERSILFLLFLSMFLVNIIYIFDLYKKIDPLPYLRGKISRDEYIQKNRPEYASYQYINRHLPKNVKIFGLFVGDRRYYCDRQMITDESIFRRFIKTAQCASDIEKALQNIGITHFVVGEEIYKSFFMGAFEENANRILSDFWELHTKKIFEDDGYSVYEIID